MATRETKGTAPTAPGLLDNRRFVKNLVDRFERLAIGRLFLGLEEKWPSGLVRAPNFYAIELEKGIDPDAIADVILLVNTEVFGYIEPPGLRIWVIPSGRGPSYLWTIEGDEYTLIEEVEQGKSPIERPIPEENDVPLIEVEPAVRHTKVAEYLGTIARNAEQIEKLHRGTDEAVNDLRDLGVSWSEIGAAAGITPQAAHLRWAPGAKERHRLYKRALRENPKKDRSD